MWNSEAALSDNSPGGSGKKKTKLEEDESIRCKCGSRFDNKGLMLCCEKCELWSHAVCYRIKKKADVPETFFCETCVPPPTELDFGDVGDAVLRAMLEGDRDAHGFKPGAPRKRVKPANEVLFRQEERTLLEKYWKAYARGGEQERPALAAMVGRLFSLSADNVEQHFVLMAEDVLDGTRGVNLAPRPAPPGRGPPLRQNAFTKSVTGMRTMREGPPNPCPERRCAGDAGGGCRDAASCHCRAHGQECEAPAGRCVQCGCGMQCFNCALSSESAPAPYAVVPHEGGWRYVSVDAVRPFGFVAEVIGKVAEAAAVASKGYWTLPLRRDCRELFVPPLGLVWDQENQGNDTRFVRRSCQANCEVRSAWVGSTLRLGVWAGSEGLKAGQEVTVPWDRQWDSLVCHVPCACRGKGVCPVTQWYGERELLASSLPVVPERIGTRRSEPQRPNKLQAELETTLNPLVTPENKMSREDRKLQQVLRTIEKLEKQEKQQSGKSASSSAAPAAAAPALPPLPVSVAAAAAAASAAATAASVADSNDGAALSPAWKKSRQSFDSTVGGDAAVCAAVENGGSLPTPRSGSLSSMAGAASEASVATPAPAPALAAAASSAASGAAPHSVGKTMGGKKAWLQKFSDSGEVPIEPAPPVEVVDHGLHSPAYGWKKRAMLEAPVPFTLEDLEPQVKKQRE